MIGVRVIDPGSGARQHALRKRRQLMMSDCCLLIALAVGIVMVIFRSAILPARFMGDEGTIQELAQGLWSSEGDSSYTQVSTLYRVLGMADNALLAGLFGYVLSCVPYIILIAKFRTLGSNIYCVICITAGILLNSVYMGSYSKEVFIVPVVLAVMLLRPNVFGFLIICALIAVYAANFRNYWFLVLVLFIVFSLSVRKVTSAWSLFVLGVTATFVGSLVFSAVMGVPADHFRLSVNVARASLGDVNTLIPRFIELGTSMDGSLNNAISFVFLQFPIPLLLKLSPYYLALFVLFSVLWIGVFSCAGKIIDLPDKQLGARLLRVTLFVLSFAITQAFFEPDYGSALKHLTPFLPLFLMLHLTTQTIGTSTSVKKGSNTLEFSS